MPAVVHGPSERLWASWAGQPYILSLPTSILLCAIAISALVRFVVRRSRVSAHSPSPVMDATRESKSRERDDEKPSERPKLWEDDKSETRPYAPPQPWETMNYTQSPLQSFSPSFPPYAVSSYSSQPVYSSIPQPTISQEDSNESDATARESSTEAGFAPPRRRSYTKNLPMPGSENVDVSVQGEIVMGEGWRRHTRVYGGGVCLACLESEQKMKDFGFTGAMAS
jgi:hypothetical protein